LEKVTSNIENLEIEAEKSLDAARVKANEIFAEANKKSQDILSSPLSFDDVKAEAQKIIKKAQQEAEEEVDNAKKQADVIRSGNVEKVDEIIDRMVKLVTGA
jgi:F0F1-type ATP synthase membrane subunit b/b'